MQKSALQNVDGRRADLVVVAQHPAGIDGSDEEGDRKEELHFT